MKKNLLIALIAAIVLPSEIFAADLPAILVVYSDIVSSIITKVIVGLVILIMLIIAAWEMKENGNARPLKWATFASIVMGGAVYFGPSMIDFMTTQVGALTGTNSVVVGS
ncbi:hypothetical protein [Sulfurimonas sp.]|uniref:hypothetical protein n=1 Tax=Sulfurimonas sp. TaxID=2022749 RepID=UPI0025E716C3|nr:hypothetical protein [Sulfurimonas sp.]